MWRRSLAVIAVLALTVLLAPQSALAAQPRTSCPPGFKPGALTFEEALALPGSQRGLADGLYTIADAEAAFDSYDANNNDLVCFQDVYSIAGERPNPASDWQYLFNIRDDSASNP
jgi:hypothetical protein